MTKSKLQELRATNQALVVEEPVFIAGYSDASWKDHPPDEGGGWGAWVRDGKQRVLGAGPCPDWVRDANDCELIAVCWAIRLALQHLDTRGSNILVIKTDNQNVCKWFGWRDSGNVPSHHEAQRLITRAYELVAEQELKLVVTWVKGHQGRGTTRGYLNDRVDGLARDARIKQEKFFWSCRT